MCFGMRLVFVLLSGFVWASGTSAGQPAVSPGELIGSVTNARAEKITHAQVIAVDVKNPAKPITARAADGFFSIRVPPGYYSLEVSAPNYQSTRSKTVRVAPSSTMIVDINLRDQTSGVGAVPVALWTVCGLLLTIIVQLILPPLASWWNRPQLTFEAEPRGP